MGETIMKIKRVLTFPDGFRSAKGQDVSPRLRKVAAVTVLDIPFAGRFEKDLIFAHQGQRSRWPGNLRDHCAVIAPNEAAGYGKAAIVGADGER
jgi:hypothetical protein